VILLALAVFDPEHLHALSARRILLPVSRNTIHFGGRFLWATAITLLPLATVFALEFIAPAHTALLSAVFLGERLPRQDRSCQINRHLTAQWSYAEAGSQSP
jgi:drug/metabolite transporter (DMT)-like permease